jgi:hypothetical protein
MTAAGSGVSIYRWSRVYVVRVGGLLMVVLGALWFAFGLAAAASGSVPREVSAVASACTAVVLAGGAWLLVRPPSLLELSPAGYRIRRVRGAGAASARWTDVHSVETRASSAGPAIVVDLSDGGTSTLPMSLLGTRAAEAQHEMHERLNAAFGYRRLRDTRRPGARRSAGWSVPHPDG